jgi:hypothetical protein
MADSPAPKMSEADLLFNETFLRWLRASSIVTNFRNTFAAVASSANEHLTRQAIELFRSLHEDPQFRGILKDIKTGEPASPAPFSVYQKFGEVIAKAIFDSSYASLDAAVLVFYHSLLDGVAFDYCRVTALHAPQDWEQDLKGSQVPLPDAKIKSYDEILKAKIGERLGKLERESLLAKADRLFARCNPPAGWSPMTGYKYDREQIELFDEQRHQVIHGKALGNPLSVFQITDESLFYVLQTGMYFMGLVNLKYGLQLTPNSLATLVDAHLE